MHILVQFMSQMTTLTADEVVSIENSFPIFTANIHDSKNSVEKVWNK